MTGTRDAGSFNAGKVMMNSAWPVCLISKYVSINDHLALRLGAPKHYF